jgi:hypothetical protein
MKGGSHAHPHPDAHPSYATVPAFMRPETNVNTAYFPISLISYGVVW